MGSPLKAGPRRCYFCGRQLVRDESAVTGDSTAWAHCSAAGCYWCRPCQKTRSGTEPKVEP
jgi:hypothetical protein